MEDSISAHHIGFMGLSVGVARARHIGMMGPPSSNSRVIAAGGCTLALKTHFSGILAIT